MRLPSFRDSVLIKFIGDAIMCYYCHSDCNYCLLILISGDGLGGEIVFWILKSDCSLIRIYFYEC